MVITSTTLREMYTNFNAIFNQAYEQTPILYPKIAMEVPSEAADETYAWLGAIPSMREWIP